MCVQFFLSTTIAETGIPIFVTPKKALPIPGQLPGIRTEMSAHFIVVSLDTVGTKIKWDGQVRIRSEIYLCIKNFSFLATGPS